MSVLSVNRHGEKEKKKFDNMLIKWKCQGCHYSFTLKYLPNTVLSHSLPFLHLEKARHTSVQEMGEGGNQMLCNIFFTERFYHQNEQTCDMYGIYIYIVLYRTSNRQRPQMQSNATTTSQLTLQLNWHHLSQVCHKLNMISFTKGCIYIGGLLCWIVWFCSICSCYGARCVVILSLYI